MKKGDLHKQIHFVIIMRKTRNSLQATTHLPHLPAVNKPQNENIKKELEEEEIQHVKPKISPRFTFKNNTLDKFFPTTKNTEIKKEVPNSFKVDPIKKEKKENKVSPKKTIVKKSSPKKRVVIEYEEVGEGTEGENQIKKETGVKKETGPPENWEIVYNKIDEERTKTPAPMDELEWFFDKTLDAKIRRYQILISLMLSSQTRDQANAKAMGNLRKHGLTPESISEITEEKLIELIRPVMYYNRKAKY